MKEWKYLRLCVLSLSPYVNGPFAPRMDSCGLFISYTEMGRLSHTWYFSFPLGTLVGPKYLYSNESVAADDLLCAFKGNSLVLI